MRIEVRFVADVHKVKGVEYLDRQTGRNATSWRLILDYEDDTGEFKCTEQVAQMVKKRNRYEFIATVDPESKETQFRITGIAENLGVPDDDDDDNRSDGQPQHDVVYHQTELAGTGIPTDSGTAGGTASQDASGKDDGVNREKASSGGSTKKAAMK